MRRAIDPRSPWSTLSVGLALAGLALTACVDKGPGPTQREIDPTYIKKNLLSSPPARMSNRVGASFGGKVVYLGNDAPTGPVTPGKPFTVVHYFQVVESPGPEWRVFTHLDGASPKGGGDWLNIDESDMRLGYGPEKWQAGDIIRDEQTVHLPGNWKAPRATIVLGLFRKGGRTVADRMPVVSGNGDQEARVVAAELRVASSAAGKRPGIEPGYIIRKAQGPIVIDGRADEDAWKRPGSSPPFTAAEGGPALRGTTRARWLWDEQNLYLFVEVQDPDVFSQYTEQDEPLWKEDVVEIFIDADRNRRGYVELQVNPNNAHFDAFFATTRAVAGDQVWNAGMRSAVALHGTLDKRDDTDKGWDLEVAIPLAAVKGRAQSMKVTLPPRPGDFWRLNVVQSDKAEGEKGALMVASWNPLTYRDFHALDRMLEVQFADETGNVAPEAEAGNPAAEEPEATKPEATKPEAGKPEAGKPEAGKPEAGKPEAGKPEAETPTTEKPAVKSAPAAEQGPASGD